MALPAGTRLGHYEIVAPLGAGGMGEVYAARDTRLDREVAIKLLPAEFAHDADRLRRFELEARATSALNHPNILTIHDIGTTASENGGAPYIVMELLEGTELRAQLPPHSEAGALTSRRALDYAQQITSGLAAAHAKGITHRDLKPENLFITSDGRVKILDFGLAKLKPPRPARIDTEASTQKQITDPGTVMGTVGYMAPEQVRGQEVDQRADIFAFGVILYEMLSGKRAFSGESAIEVMNAILKEEPPELSETNAKVAPALEKIVRRCLEKKPEQRFHSAHDLGYALEALSAPSGARLEATTALPVVTASESSAGRRERLAWFTAGALLLGVLGFAWAYFTRQPEADTRVFKTSLLPPEKSSFGSFAVSPDGKWLAFAAATGGKVQLWVRALDALEAKPLAGTEGAENPFWSPDSRFIGFFAGGSLKKIEASGGPVQTLAFVRINYGGAWNRDGVIIFGGPSFTMISRVAATGGAVTPVTKQDAARQQHYHMHPAFLPDGRHFLYYVQSVQREIRGIYLGSLDGGEPQRLLDDVSNALYAAAGSGAGWLLFVRDGALLAQSFDLRRLQLGGEPVLVAERVGRDASSIRGNFTVSGNGVLICDTSGNTAQNRLQWIDRSGNSLGVLPVTEIWGGPRLSFDEKRFVVDRRDPQTGIQDLWLYDVTGSNPARFTFGLGANFNQVWSPDGSHLVWGSNREGVYHLYKKAASGAGQDELLLKSESSKFPCDWSRDGHFIIYTQLAKNGKFDLWVLPTGPLSNGQKPFPFLQTEMDETVAWLAPSGRWLAYASDESGRYEVYVQRFPEGGSKRQLSLAGGIGPSWRRDGKELFYYAADGKLMAVAVPNETLSAASFEGGAPVALFEYRSSSRGGVAHAHYTVTADGQRFLINTIVETQAAAPLTVVVNWAAEVKR